MIIKITENLLVTIKNERIKLQAGKGIKTTKAPNYEPVLRAFGADIFIYANCDLKRLKVVFRVGNENVSGRAQLLVLILGGLAYRLTATIQIG